MTDTQVPTVETPDIGIPVGAPVWMDLVTDDPAKAGPFYAALFDWTLHSTPPEFGGYQYFNKGDRAVGGCMINDPAFGMPNVWSIFLKTEDSKATEAAAKANGGEVLMETMEVGSNGSFTIVKDPSGAVISAWQPGTESGFGVLGEENTPIHFELHTRDEKAAVNFYTDVFGWKANALPNEYFTYTVFGTAEEPRAGIMDGSQFMPPEMPAHWSVYIKVSDAEAIVSKAQELGGTLLMGVDDTPFGKLAVLTDPTGAVFKIQQV